MNENLAFDITAGLRAEISSAANAVRHFVEASQSPSLRPNGASALPAFEVKFLLTDSRALELERQLSEQLTLDPHADPALDNSYRIATVYADTPRFDVYHRSGSHKYRKFRLRRYGNELLTYLERKTKRGQRVRKRRTTMEPNSVLRIDEANPTIASATDWYRRSWSRHALRPVCRVSYTRRAYFGACDEGPLRMTFDRELRAAPTDQLAFDADAQETPIGDGRVICEFKFRGHLPAIFKIAMETFQIVPGGFSKYRNAVRALGLVPANTDAKGASDA